MGIRVKVELLFGGTGVSHEGSICNLWDRGRVYGMSTGTSIYLVMWVQWYFTFIVVDDVNFASQYDKVYKWNCVGDVLDIIPGKNRSFTQAPVDEAGYEPYGIFIKESPKLITVSKREELNADHVIYVWWGQFTCPLIEEEYPPLVSTITS